MKELLDIGGDVNVAAMLRAEHAESRAVRRKLFQLICTSIGAAALYVSARANPLSSTPIFGSWYGAFGGLAVLWAAYLLWRGSKYRRKSHLIADTPTTAIKSAAQGNVSLHGIARPLNGLTHRPFEGMPECVWFTVSVVRVKKRQGLLGVVHTFNPPPTPSDMPPGFILEDASGQCRVLTVAGRTHCLNAETWEKQIGSSLYTVHYLRPGSPVHVLGHFSSHRPDTGPETRQSKWLDALRAVKSNQTALLARFDTNGDKQLDEAEWETTKQAIQAEVDLELQRASTEPATHHVSASHDIPLVISNRKPDIAAKHHATLSLFYTGAAILHFVGGASLLMN